MVADGAHDLLDTEQLDPTPTDSPQEARRQP
jgi:hypothetical protein